MMNGRLEDSAAEDVWLDLPRPAVLDTPLADWTDEIRAVAAAFAKQTQQLSVRS